MKIHKKLYKAKKQWCCMALTAAVASIGMVLAPHVYASTDTATPTNNTSVTESMEDGQNNKSVTLQSQDAQSADGQNSQQSNNDASTTTGGQVTTDQKTDPINSQTKANAVKSSDTNNNALKSTTVTTPVQNGWSKNSQGQMEYRQNGQTATGRQYVELPTIPNTHVSGTTNWYLMDNGVAQSGFQEWMGSHYYFDPETYLVVKNNYVDTDGTDSGYLLGKDGIALNGIQKWQGTYYAFDYDTYRLVKNRKFNEWGNTYQIDNQGRVVSGLYKDSNGDVYYYNPSSYLAETNTYIVPAGTQNGYLFGQVGKALSGVQKWQGTYYYFDPQTKQLVRNDYVKSQWGLWYMVGPNGALVTGPYNWQGSTYYFDESSYLKVDNDYRVPAGSDRGYLLGSNGQALSGLQEWQGNYWYFDPQTHLLVKNTYVDPDGNDSGYLLAPDGHALTGIQKWQGTYYAFDYNTYRLVKNKYFKSQWGLSYQIDDKGRVVSGYYRDANGDVYYYDPSSYLRATNTYMVPAGTQNGYLFGNDGKALSGVQKWQGTYYYFDPTTKQLVRNNYVKSQWGLWYMVGPNGSLVTGQYNWQGSTYYFDPSSYLMATNKWVDGHYYGNDGIQYRNRLLNDGQHIYYLNGDGNKTTNQFVTVAGKTYYFGNDGVALTGHQTINGKNYTFNSQGQLMGAIYGKVENGKLNIYRSVDNKLLKSLDSGDWENMAYSFDSSSINNVDGYLSYTGWYRPYGTSQDGKTWYKTTASDWRPLLMYIWPSKDVEAKYIKYFVDNGYTNDNYGLTSANVDSLSGSSDSDTLDQYARSLRFVIEQSIAKEHSTSQLATDINNFVATIPELSSKSELPVEYSKGYVPDKSGTIDDDQVIFVNNNSTNQAQGNTSYADSNYRLMNRTINNQTNKDTSDSSPELLVGNDIDNSNPVVQAENFNWEYFLLNYGKIMGYNSDGSFDGFRVDAADNIDADVLDQLGQLVNDMYHTNGNQINANNHLVYNEGYHSGAAKMLNGKGNPELYMDANMYNTLENTLGRQASQRDNINNIATNSEVNRTNDVNDNEATPNWSFVTNHDQRKNTINQIIIDDHPGVPDILGNSYRAEYAGVAWEKFYADEAKTDKQYAQYNLPAQYAILLSNKDTVPQIYYGDLFKETDQYMQTKTMYYDAITTLMKARHEFVSGGQSMAKINDHLLTSVRYGKGVKDANSLGTDPISKTTGMAVVVGNDPTMAEQIVEINMGKEHANQQYKNLIDSTADGLTYDSTGSTNPAVLTTDANGILRITVKGYSNPYVSGYLSVWVPVIGANQDATTKSSEVKNVSNKTFVSNAALDSHVIYEDFSLFQPEPTSKEEHAYNVIKNNASLFSSLGITDFWMAPAYTPFNMSRYNEGYSMTDRYNLGTNESPTKYGSGQELSDAIAALHASGLKVQEDIVFNQMIGFSTQEAVTVTRANNYGQQLTVDGQTFANQIYFGYTRGGGQGQKDYGGKYLDLLKSKYPDLFTTKAISTGVAPDPTTHITEWSAKYENGTSLQNIGIGLAVKLPYGYYAYLNDGNNKAFDTTLPDAISSADYYADKEGND